MSVYGCAHKFEKRFVQAFIRMRACSGVPRRGFAVHIGIAGYHRHTSPINIFNQINHEILAKFELSSNTWREGKNWCKCC